MKAFRFCFTLCGLTLIMTAAAFAQPDSLWSRTFGRHLDDFCLSVQQTTDGGYILGGSTESYGAGDSDFWLVKTDANGIEEWNRTFGGSDSDYGRSIQQTTDGGYILGGATESYGAGDTDFWLVRADENGDSLWSRTFGGSGSDWCSSVQQTSGGGYILGGYTSSYGSGDFDFWLVKTDAGGIEEWSRTFGGDNMDACFSVQQTADGGYILGGTTESFGASAYDCWLVRADANGDSLWSRVFAGSDYDECHSVLQTTDGGYILAGGTHSYGAGNWDFWMVRVDANGDSLWSRTFGGRHYDCCFSIQHAADGGYILGGTTESYGAGYYDFWLVKTNSLGDIQWNRTFGGSHNDYCKSVQRTNDGGYILAGWTLSYGSSGYNFWLVKTGPDPVAADPMLNPMPDKYALHQNYPNPFNPSTQITFDLTKASYVSLKIFDLLGREVTTLVDDMQPAGNHSVTFDGSQFPSGIYFYRLKTGEFTTTRKMVLLK